jgi:outer membrane protein OmpA-like peptidoglycan-associated protein
MDWIRGLFALLALLLVGSIAFDWATNLSDPPEPGLVARRWAEGIGQLRLSPLFPPREDIEVGDIYLERPNASDRAPELASSDNEFWLGNLGLEKTIADTYKRRFAWPPEASDSEAGRWRLPEKEKGIFAVGSEATRLRSVSLPAFTVTSLRSSDLATSYRLAGLFGGLFGGTAHDNYTITVSIPYAESYGLPVVDIMRKIQTFCGITQEELGYAADQLMEMSSAGKHTAGPLPILEVITELIYARSIDYNVTSGYGAHGIADATRAGMASIKDGLEELAAAVRKTSGQAQGKSSSEQPNAQSASPNADRKISQMKSELDQVLETFKPAAAPGVSGTVMSANSHSITMRQILANPVAIGYRALRFSIPGRGKTTASTGLPAFKPCTEKVTLPSYPMAVAPIATGPFMVHFSDGDMITPEGQQEIAWAAKAIKANPNASVFIYGYTDNSGSPATNRRISQRRAQKVEQALLAAGVPQSAVKELQGLGSTNERLPMPPDSREPENRRAEIVIR